jgi:hypothetical protein
MHVLGAEVAPVVYAYAYTMVEGKTPGQVPGVLTETFTKTIEESRAAARTRSDPATTRSCGWTILSSLLTVARPRQPARLALAIAGVSDPTPGADAQNERL